MYRGWGGPSSAKNQRVEEVYVHVSDPLSRRGLPQYMHEDFFARLDMVMLEARSGDGYMERRKREQDEGLVMVHYWLYRNASNLSNYAQELLEEMSPSRTSATNVSCVRALTLATSRGEK